MPVALHVYLKAVSASPNFHSDLENTEINHHMQ